MSYILEALKKSERERKRVRASAEIAPQTAQPIASPTGSWSGLRIAPIVIVLLAVAVFAYFMLQPSMLTTEVRTNGDGVPLQPGQAVAGSHESDGLPDEAAPVALPITDEVGVPEPHADPVGMPIHEERPPAVEMAHPPVKPEPPAETVTLPAVEPPIEPIPERLPELDKVPTPARAPPPIKAPKSQLPYWYETSAALQAAIAQPRIDVHVYAERPEQRILLIEMHRYREGEVLPNGLRLERITQEGAEFSWQGERFRVDRQ